jgi:hypothetical protein
MPESPRPPQKNVTCSPPWISRSQNTPRQCHSGLSHYRQIIHLRKSPQNFGVLGDVGDIGESGEPDIPFERMIFDDVPDAARLSYPE